MPPKPFPFAGSHDNGKKENSFSISGKRYCQSPPIISGAKNQFLKTITIIPRIIIVWTILINFTFLKI